MTKLGIWVLWWAQVQAVQTWYVVYKFMRVLHPIWICSDWLMDYKDETWYVGSGGGTGSHKYRLHGPQKKAGTQIFEYLPRAHVVYTVNTYNLYAAGCPRIISIVFLWKFH